MAADAPPAAIAEPGPDTTTNTAGAASAALRTTCLRPTGAECSAPKQPQSGASPRARAFTMAPVKAARSTSAAAAPQIAKGCTSSAAAVASSAIGSATAPMRAGRSPTPNPRSVRRKSGRSASLPTPATTNTAASSSLAARTAASMAYGGGGSSRSGAVQSAARVEQHELDPDGQVGHCPPGISVAHTVQMQLQTSLGPAGQTFAGDAGGTG